MNLTANPHPRGLFSLHIRVENLSHIGEARRRVIALARDLGFDDLRIGQT